MMRIHRSFQCLACLVFTGTLPAQETVPLLEGFKRVDDNGDGRISPAELARFPRLETRISGDDTSRDGFLSFEEFRNRMLATSDAGEPVPPASGRLAPGEHTRGVTVGEVRPPTVALTRTLAPMAERLAAVPVSRNLIQWFPLPWCRKSANCLRR